jgi:uncharacterized protein
MSISNNYIEREQLYKAIKPFVGKQIIKIIVGQRRVGKSSFLKKFMENIKDKVIYINKELYEFDFIKDYHDLIKYVESKTIKEKNILIIDEVQDIKFFEKALRHFQEKNIYDIYCTGSNANLLSSDLATFLSGRYIQIEVHSLSFSEFLNFHKDVNLEDYFLYGGMPYLRNLDLSTDVAFHYLKSVYESIILKDVVERYSLRNVKFLENLVSFLAINIGSLTTANNISNFLKSQDCNINVQTVMNYIEALKSCFFIYEVPRYDIVGEKIFEINHKYYIEDIGIRNSIVGYNQPRDEGKVLENIVFMDLKRKGYDICIGVLEGKEIDFIATKNNEKIYIQVALRIEEQETFHREFQNLLDIKDNYRKFVITKDANSINTYKGIEHISLDKALEIF